MASGDNVVFMSAVLLLPYLICFLIYCGLAPCGVIIHLDAFIDQLFSEATLMTMLDEGNDLGI